MALGQVDVVVRDLHYRNNAGEEFYLAGGLAKSLLQQIFLCFALVSSLLVFGRFDLFHQVTPAIAMKPWFVPVLAKFSSDIILVEFKAGVNKKPRKPAADNAENKQYGNEFVFHEQFCKGKIVTPICKQKIS